MTITTANQEPNGERGPIAKWWMEKDNVRTHWIDRVRQLNVPAKSFLLPVNGTGDGCINYLDVARGNSVRKFLDQCAVIGGHVDPGTVLGH